MVVEATLLELRLEDGRQADARLLQPLPDDLDVIAVVAVGEVCEPLGLWAAVVGTGRRIVAAALAVRQAVSGAWVPCDGVRFLGPCGGIAFAPVGTLGRGDLLLQARAEVRRTDVLPPLPAEAVRGAVVPHPADLAAAGLGGHPGRVSPPSRGQRHVEGPG